MSTPAAATTPRRLRAAWHAAHAPVPGVPRWARIAAHAVPFTALPAGAWRIAVVVCHVPLDGGAVRDSGSLPSWLPIEAYVLVLSLVSELLAFTAVGLVAGWGEVFPRWLPLLRGRRVPVPVAVVPAALGATVLTLLWTAVLVVFTTRRTLQGRPLSPDNPLAAHDWHAAVLAACYGPLLLWGPLLAAVTVAYWRRRRPARAGGPRP
ncbi:hypothetical protein AB0O91_16975 [Kitasatospora sp. NPDC089797]|uniref:hypothetical protein n=1 Tax=Kitasatospora sp. NPDC089797 TaxID=3155298 RepID=UPI0034128A55